MKECTICMEPLGPTARIIQLHPDTPCVNNACHYVHQDCWYNDNNDDNNILSKCPVCRVTLPQRNANKRLKLGSFIDDDGALHLPAEDVPAAAIGGKTKKHNKRKNIVKTRKYKKIQKYRKYRKYRK